MAYDMIEGIAPQIHGVVENCAITCTSNASMSVPHGRSGLKVVREVVARIPTPGGVFSLALYSNNKDNKEHLAIVYGPLSALQDGSRAVFVRVHSECFTGEVIGSLRCDCGEQLRTALDTIASEGCGVVIFLRQEGRGIGLKQKLKAYNLQDQGFDTVEANLMLGHQADERNYEAAALILEDLGVDAFHLLTNNPTKIDALRHYGLNIISRVEMVPQQVTVDTLRYLTTKVARMQHGIKLESLKVSPCATRLWSCPASPTHPSPHGSPPEQSTSEFKAPRNPRTSAFKGESTASDHIEGSAPTAQKTVPNSMPQVFVTNNITTNITTNICAHAPVHKESPSATDVVAGVVRPEAAAVQGRPFVTVTYAQSLDGSIATASRSPLTLSGPESMEMTHKLRADHNAILVGIGTVLADDPRLTVRLVAGVDPRPVVLDSSLRMPLTARMLDNTVKPWILCGPHADDTKAKLLAARGADIIRVDSLANGRLDLGSALIALWARGITSLMVEGGASVIHAFLISQLVDACVITISPEFVNGLRSLDAKEHYKLPRLENTRTHQLGKDIVVVGTPRW